MKKLAILLIFILMISLSNCIVTYASKKMMTSKTYSYSIGKNRTVNKLKVELYKLKVKEMDGKISEQNNRVRYADDNLRKNPASSTAMMLYNSAKNLLQTYQKLRDNYYRLQRQAEAGY